MYSMTIKEKIKNQISDPEALENLYRKDQSSFKKAFLEIYSEIADQPMAGFWKARLQTNNDSLSWGHQAIWTFLLPAIVAIALLVKMPDIIGLDPEFYYPRNLGFIVCLMILLFFIRQRNTPLKWQVGTGLFMLGMLGYINSLPANPSSNTLVLACLHLPIVLWGALGWIFSDVDLKNQQGRIDFLKYNGDLAVMSALLFIAAGILSAITTGLFEMIGISIKDFYFRNIAICGAASVPLVATWLVHYNPMLVRRVSPTIASIFTPLVIISLTSFLIALLFNGKNPFHDREFLIVFNLMLIGVMAIIIFVVTASEHNNSRIYAILLLVLAILALCINAIALSAIIFRITSWGFTPNRLAVSGSNLLVMINLLMVTMKLIRSVFNRTSLTDAEQPIASFLPVYPIWSLIVTILLPLLFQFV